MKTLSHYFKSIACDPPTDWEGRLFARLERVKYERTRRFRRVALFGIGLSLGGVGMGIVEYGSMLVTSPFWSLLGLVVSDLASILQTLPDFAYSLLETLPIVPLLVLFTSLTLFFWSLSFWTKLTPPQASHHHLEII